MEEYTVKILFTIFGLYSGVLGWLFKSHYQEFRELKKEHDQLKLRVTELRIEIMEDVDDKFDIFLGNLDAKLDNWWAKIECNLMNEGRIAPKKTMKEKGGVK